MPGSITDILRQNDPFEQLVQQLITLESKRKFALEDQRESQKTTKSAVSGVGTKLTSLNSLLTNLQQPSANQFKPLMASSTTDAFQVTAGEFLRESGNYSMQVQNIASADIVTLQDTVSATGTELVDGMASFDIAIGNGDPVNISFDTSDFSDNAEVLGEVRRQINDALGSQVSVNVYNVDGENLQLSIRSRDTGSANRIQITNTTGVFNTETNFQNQLADPADLNARFSIDGVQFTRSSNTINDAIPNLTIQLLDTTTGNQQIIVENDVESARGSVDNFIQEYNNVIKDIRQKTFLNPDTGDRGPLQQDRTFRTLVSSMRQSLLQSVGSAGGTGGFVDGTENFQNEGISSFDVVVAGGSVTNVTVDTTGLTKEDALNQISSQINAITGVSSSVTESNGSFRLEIQGADPQTEINLSNAQGASNLINDLSLSGTQGLKNIFDLGLNFNQDGTLYIQDEARLNEAIQQSPGQMQQLFNAPDGLAANLQNEVDRFVRGSNSVINILERNIDDRIESLSSRISRQETFLQRREEQLRNEFIQLQQLIESSQSQFQQLQSIQAGLF